MERGQEEGVSHASGAAAARSGLAVAFFLKVFVAGETPAWCVFVEFVQQAESSVKSAGKVDYMKILSQEEFSVFSKLRELRKAVAAKDGVPLFVVFTDEQLALIERPFQGRLHAAYSHKTTLSLFLGFAYHI